MTVGRDRGLEREKTTVQGQQGQMCWVARTDDLHFSEAHLERTPEGSKVILRKMDTVESFPLTLPFTIVDDNDMPEHLR